MKSTTIGRNFELCYLNPRIVSKTNCFPIGFLGISLWMWFSERTLDHKRNSFMVCKFGIFRNFNPISGSEIIPSINSGGATKASHPIVLTFQPTFVIILAKSIPSDGYNDVRSKGAEMLRAILIALSPLILGGLAVVLFFLPSGDEVKAYDVWIPENGQEGDILDIDYKRVCDPFCSSDEIQEIPLEEFQTRGYEDILYGIWVGDENEVYLFYWVPGEHDAGVWARDWFFPEFGQSPDLFAGYIQDEQLIMPWERDMSWGHTPIPNTGPKYFYIFLFSGLGIASGILLYPISKSGRR